MWAINVAPSIQQALRPVAPCRIMHYIKTVVASVDMLLPWETVREPYEVRSPIKAEYSNVRMFVDANPFFILLHRLGGQYDNPGFFEVGCDVGTTLPLSDVSCSMI